MPFSTDALFGGWSPSQYNLVRFGVTVSVTLPGHSNKYDNFHVPVHHIWKSGFYPRNTCNSLGVCPLATRCFQQLKALFGLHFTIFSEFSLTWFHGYLSLFWVSFCDLGFLFGFF